VTTRPTTDRVREAVFNSLVSMDLLLDAHVVDVFAGSGALGIEALSRGAATCTFVERDRRALDALRENVDALKLSSRVTVIPADATLALTRVLPASVMLADPPYGFEQWAEVLAHSPAPFVVAESSRQIGTIDGWRSTREKRYGRAFVTFLERGEQLADEVDDEAETVSPDELHVSPRTHDVR
jgi:16S rRNA (guanine966-N2)-methyltransferase